MMIHNLPEYADAYEYILYRNLGDEGCWFYGAYPTIGKMCAAASELNDMGDNSLAWCYSSDAISAD